MVLVSSSLSQLLHMLVDSPDHHGAAIVGKRRPQDEGLAHLGSLSQTLCCQVRGKFSAAGHKMLFERISFVSHRCVTHVLLSALVSTSSLNSKGAVVATELHIGVCLRPLWEPKPYYVCRCKRVSSESFLRSSSSEVGVKSDSLAYGCNTVPCVPITGCSDNTLQPFFLTLHRAAHN